MQDKSWTLGLSPKDITSLIFYYQIWVTCITVSLNGTIRFLDVPVIDLSHLLKQPTFSTFPFFFSVACSHKCVGVTATAVKQKR